MIRASDNLMGDPFPLKPRTNHADRQTIMALRLAAEQLRGDGREVIGQLVDDAADRILTIMRTKA